MADRVSQEAVEALYVTTAAKARVSQEAVEVLWQFHPVSNRVSQLAVEVLSNVVTGVAGALTAGLAKRMVLPSGYSVRWRAIDANGNDVAGVAISQASVFGTES